MSPSALPNTGATNPPLYITCVDRAALTFHELAWDEIPDLAHLIRREDIPRLPYRLPRPLTTEQDQLLQREFLRRNDLGANAFLLIRHTGMRIGECADLASDCLRSTGPDQWAIHVPLGKLKTERLVPVDPFVCKFVQRLRFFRSLERLPNDEFLLPRPRKEALVRQPATISIRSVMNSVFLYDRPTQLATYASELLRAVGFLTMNLRSRRSEHDHAPPDVTLTDLKREFQLARSKPRHLAPQPTSLLAPARTGLNGVIDALSGAQHVLEMFRRTLPTGATRSCLDRLSNRLTKIIAKAKSLGSN
jgi:hypothetical protein